MYTIELTLPDTEKVDLRVVRCLKPTSSDEVLQARLIKLAKYYSGEVVVKQGACPFLLIKMSGGRIIYNYFCGDKRKPHERDLDMFYESRSRIKNQRVGRAAGDLTSWIKSPVTNENRKGLLMIDKEGYKLAERITSRKLGG